MKLSVLSTGQYALPWYIDHCEAISHARQRAIAKRREDVARLRRERGGIKHLLSLAELPEAYLTKDELARLDEYVNHKMDEIKRAWTPEQEAQARGVMLRKTDRWFVSDGRLFQNGVGIMQVGTDEWGDVYDECE